MRTSNLVECLEEFAATMGAVDVPKEKPPRVAAVDDCGPPRRAPRRFESRRIQIRDTGLPQFRVF